MRATWDSAMFGTWRERSSQPARRRGQAIDHARGVHGASVLEVLPDGSGTVRAFYPTETQTAVLAVGAGLLEGRVPFDPVRVTVDADGTVTAVESSGIHDFWPSGETFGAASEE